MANDIDISVFICSRKRIEGLREAVESTYTLASHPERVQVLLRVDEDDPTTVFFATEELSKKYPFLEVIVGVPFDFKDLWMVYRDLAALCTGDIIVPFTDDYLVGSKGWDDHLLGFREDCLVVSAYARLAITRKAYDKYEYIRNMTGKNDALDQRIVIFAKENRCYKRVNKWYVRNCKAPESLEDRIKIVHGIREKNGRF